MKKKKQKLPAFPLREGMEVDVPGIGPDYRFHGTGYTVKGTVIMVCQSASYALIEVKRKAGKYTIGVHFDSRTGKFTDGIRSRTIQSHITRPRAALYGDILPQKAR